MTARMGIRELREGISRAIRRVRAGETIEVTDRGRPVARLVPLMPSSPDLERLIEEGKLHPPTARGPLPEPLDLPATMTPEEALDILRGD